MATARVCYDGSCWLDGAPELETAAASLLLGFATLSLDSRKVADAPVFRRFAWARNGGRVARSPVWRGVDTAVVDHRADADEGQPELNQFENPLVLGRRGEHGLTLGRAT